MPLKFKKALNEGHHALKFGLRALFRYKKWIPLKFHFSVGVFTGYNYFYQGINLFIL